MDIATVVWIIDYPHTVPEGEGAAEYSASDYTRKLRSLFEGK